MKKNNGICQLCLNERILRNSHIYPKWVIKNCRDYTSKPARFITVPKTTLQDGPKTYLPCNDCEKKFQKRETYVHDLVLFQKSYREPVKLSKIDSDKIEISPYRFQETKYFIMSVLWRLAVCKIDGWSIRMKAHDKEHLRQCLLNESTFAETDFPTWTTHIWIDGVNDSKIMSPPHQINTECGSFVEIYLAGIVFTCATQKINPMCGNMPLLQEHLWTSRIGTPYDLPWLLNMI